MLFWFELISADMTKVLVCVMNSRTPQLSSILKLYGDPKQYVYKLANDTFVDKLPIQMNWVWHRRYDIFRSISLDQYRQRVWLGSSVDQGVGFAFYIYHNSTLFRYSFYNVPKTNQVLQYY